MGFTQHSHLPIALLGSCENNLCSVIDSDALCSASCLSPTTRRPFARPVERMQIRTIIVEFGSNLVPGRVRIAPLSVVSCSGRRRYSHSTRVEFHENIGSILELYIARQRSLSCDYGKHLRSSSRQ